MKSPHQRLRDILEAVARIERFLPTSGADLMQNEERQVWFVHHLQIIGEAARTLSDDVRSQMPAVPWRQWVGLRHILVHEHFGIDVPAVQKTIRYDLAPLSESIATWLEQKLDE